MTTLFPRYRHIVKPVLKHTYLSFDDEGNLIIKSPKVSQRYIEQVLLKKAAWINRSREKFWQKKGRAVDFSSPSVLYYKGELYPLTLVKHDKKSTKLILEAERFYLRYHRYDESVFQKCVDAFYKERAYAAILPLVEKWSKQMALQPEAIRFRKTKRQWGSCSGKNILSFNTMLMKLPESVAEYIVVHELAHIRYKHHQKSFWSLVASYLPDYKQRMSELHTYTT